MKGASPLVFGLIVVGRGRKSFVHGESYVQDEEIISSMSRQSKVGQEHWLEQQPRCYLH